MTKEGGRRRVKNARKTFLSLRAVVTIYDREGGALEEIEVEDEDIEVFVSIPLAKNPRFKESKKIPLKRGEGFFRVL